MPAELFRNLRFQFFIPNSDQVLKKADVTHDATSTTSILSVNATESAKYTCQAWNAADNQTTDSKTFDVFVSPIKG